MKARLGYKIVFFSIYIIIYVHYRTYTYLDNHLHIPNPPSSFHQLAHKHGHTVCRLFGRDLQPSVPGSLKGVTFGPHFYSG
jgi:hypothetical protein